MANDNNTQDVSINAIRAVFGELLKKGEPDKKPAGKAFRNIDAQVGYEGTKIILPGDPNKMSFSDAREWLTRLENAENQAVQIIEPIKDAHPWDGAVAFMKALKEIYGWANPVPTPGFFGPQPPRTISIETGPGETAMIFWGSFQIPGIEGNLMTHVDHDGPRPVFTIVGTMKKKYVEAVHAIAELTRKIVREQSIYRGKALRLNVDDNGDINYESPPTFLDLSRVDENELVFSEDLRVQVQTNLWTPIEHTALCRKEKVPLKRGVMLEGPYGTGKTLAATVTAKKCEANGWTFLTVPRASALEPALHFAANYQPCALFVEDIDREMVGERTAEMDDILNTVDGILSKGAEIMVVLTSNHADKINRAMLRPGRLDAILHIDAPDAAAVEKLIRVYGRKLIKKDADLSEAGIALAGKIPAVIRECVERSKLYAIGMRPNEQVNLTAADIVYSAKGMEHHLRLLDGEKAPEQTPAEKLGQALAEVLDHGLSNGLSEGGGFAARVKNIQTTVASVERLAKDIRRQV